MKITPGGEGDLELRLAGESTSVWLNLSGQDGEFPPSADVPGGEVASCSAAASSICLPTPATKSPSSHGRRALRPDPDWCFWGPNLLAYGTEKCLAPNSSDESFDTTGSVETAMGALLVTVVQHIRSRANLKADAIALGTPEEDEEATVGVGRERGSDR